MDLEDINKPDQFRKINFLISIKNNKKRRHSNGGDQ